MDHEPAGRPEQVGIARQQATVTPALLVCGLGMNNDAVDAHNFPYTVHVVFMIGAVLSLSTILWSVIRVPELPLIYNNLLAGDARNVLTLAGVLLVCAAWAVMRVKDSELG